MPQPIGFPGIDAFLKFSLSILRLAGAAVPI
jgi:hypothetical protein